MTDMIIKNVKPLDPIPKGESPFLHDQYNMGQQVGKDLWLMHGNHPVDECSYLILVNTKTGSRECLVLDESCIDNPLPLAAETMNGGS